MSGSDFPSEAGKDIAADIKALRKTIEELSLEGGRAEHGLGFNGGRLRRLADAAGEETDNFDGSGGRVSPLMANQATRSRVPRPRRRPEDEHYIHSVSETNLGRLRSRRRSDPGRISVSPMRGRRLDNEMISEDGSSDEEFNKQKLSNPRLIALKCSKEVEEYADVAELASIYARDRQRSRSPHMIGARRQGRSQSLPGPDPALIEIGEAIGALAISKPEPLLEVPRSLSPGGGPPRRRRSVSVECTPLEAIVEETNVTKNPSRRFSTPVNAMLGPQ